MAKPEQDFSEYTVPVYTVYTDGNIAKDKYHLNFEIFQWKTPTTGIHGRVYTVYIY